MRWHETWQLKKVPEIHMHISFLTQNSGYFRSTRSGFLIQAVFLNCPYIGMKPDHREFFRRCTYSLFLPQGSKLELFSIYGQRFSDRDGLLKLPYFCMKLGYWKKFQKLNIDSLSTQVGGVGWGGVPNCVYFTSTETVIKIEQYSLN